MFETIFCLLTGDVQDIRHQMAPKTFQQRDSHRPPPPMRVGSFPSQSHVTCVRTYKLNNRAYLQKFGAGWGPESMTSNNRTEEGTSPRQSPSWKQSRAGGWPGATSTPSGSLKLCQPLLTLDWKAAGGAGGAFLGDN